jgi:hypothetical protein
VSVRIGILYFHIQMLILTVERRNLSMNGPVCSELCENINPLNVHSLSFEIQVGTCEAIHMLYMNYNIDPKFLYLYKIERLTDLEFSVKPRGAPLIGLAREL